MLPQRGLEALRVTLQVHDLRCLRDNCSSTELAAYALLLSEAPDRSALGSLPTDLVAQVRDLLVLRLQLPRLHRGVRVSLPHQLFSYFVRVRTGLKGNPKIKTCFSQVSVMFSGVRKPPT